MAKRRQEAGQTARGREGPARLRAWRAGSGQGFEDAAREVIRDVTAASMSYDRRRILPRLIGFDIRELEAGQPGEALGCSIRTRLERALRAERRRGIAGHWTYDLARHVALARALACEQAMQPSGCPAPHAATKSDRVAPETKNAARRTGRR